MSQQDDELRFVEMAGELLEEHGMPRMAGRVLGALMICVPPRLTMRELADRLQASKGSISTATRLLLRLGLIERVSAPGCRAREYRMRRDAFSSLFVQENEHLVRHREFARLGLAILREQPVELQRRVLEMQAFFEFVGAELPRLVSRWRSRRERPEAEAEAAPRKDPR